VDLTQGHRRSTAGTSPNASQRGSRNGIPARLAWLAAVLTGSDQVLTCSAIH
jgi:hypothetical protein